MTARPMPLWERNLRTLADNAERASLHVVQCYAQDVRDLLRVLDGQRQQIEEAKQAAVAALETADVRIPTLAAKGAGR